MIILLFILLGIAAIMGGYLLTYVLAEKNTPKGIAIIHGIAGALSILLLSILSYSYPTFLYSLIFFIFAAAGGFVLLSFDLLGKKIPKLLALGHGTLAITGLIILIAIFAYLH